VKTLSTSEEIDPKVSPVQPPSDQRQLLLAAMLVASSDDAIVGKDYQSVVTTWNPAAQRLYGYAAEEVVGGLTRPGFLAQASTRTPTPSDMRTAE
jgi:PAS domain-containing protein